MIRTGVIVGLLVFFGLALTGCSDNKPASPPTSTLPLQPPPKAGGAGGGANAPPGGNSAQ